MGICAGRTQDMQVQNYLAQALLQDHGGFHGVLSVTPIILCQLGKRAQPPRWLCIFKKCSVPSASAGWAQLSEEVAPVLLGHIAVVKVEAQREAGVEVDVGGPQMQGDQAVPGPPCGWISLGEFGSSWCSAIRR